MKKDNNIKVYIILVVICLFVLILSIFIANLSKEEVSIQSTSENQGITEQKKMECPTISKGIQNIDEINQEIENLCSIVKQNQENVLQNRTNETDDIYSSIIVAGYYEDDAVTMTYQVKSVNIDLKRGVLLTNDDILKRFNTSTEQVKMRIEETLQYYYEDEINQGYLSREQCDYNCFLSLRGLKNSNVMEKVQFYMGDNKLFAYIPFTIQSSLADEDYYPNPIDAFRILISN